MIRMALGLTLSLCATTSLAAPIQWSSTVGGNDHWYEIVTTPKNWDDARADAVSRVHDGLRGYLVSVTSAAENDFILQTFQPGQYQGVWTGGTDQDQYGTYVWADSPEEGSPFRINHVDVGYTGWFPGEPTLSQQERHVELGFFGDYWNNRTGNHPWAYLVEYGELRAPAPVPVPASGLLLIAALGLSGFAARKKRS